METIWFEDAVPYVAYRIRAVDGDPFVSTDAFPEDVPDDCPCIILSRNKAELCRLAAVSETYVDVAPFGGGPVLRLMAPTDDSHIWRTWLSNEPVRLILMVTE